MNLTPTTTACLLIMSFCLISGKVNYDNKRLPRDVLPISYELTVEPEFVDGKPEVVKGNVKILIEVFNNTNLIILNSLGLEFGSTDVILKPSNKPRQIRLRSVTFEKKNQIALLNFNEVLKLGQKYTLNIKYVAKVNADNSYKGFYASLYSRKYRKYLLATELEPIHARTIMPCFDEIDMKAVFDLRIVRKAHQFALSNGKKYDSINNGYAVTDYFERTPVMSTYLVCIVVGDLVFLETPTQNKSYDMQTVTAKIYEPYVDYPNKYWIAPSIDFMEKTTTIPYAMNKLDHVVLRNFGGAMENWGLITYSTKFFSNLTADNKLNNAFVIAHEIAHQWYGNLVTCKWWYDLWLQEGFVSYYSSLAMGALGWDGESLQQLYTIQKVLQREDNGTPVRKNITSILDVGSHFDESTYEKGAAVIRIIERVLSKDIFTEAMTHYLKKHQYSVAGSEDLFQVLDQYADKYGIKFSDGSSLSFTEFLVPWLDQIGYPIVKVQKSGQGKAKVSQLTHKRNAENRWDIPLRVTSLSKDPVNYWLRREQDEIEINTPDQNWFLVNPNQSFLYRVWYDEEERRLHSKHLMEMSPSSRAQIIDDSFELAKNHYYTLETPLNNMAHLHKEENLVSWDTTLQHLNMIFYSYQNEKWRSSLASFLQKKAAAVLHRIGNTNQHGEAIETELLRDMLLKLFPKYVSAKPHESNEEKIHKFIEYVQIGIGGSKNQAELGCEVVAEGSAETFEEVKRQYKLMESSKDIEEKLVFLYSLGCSTEAEKISSLFNDLINGSFVEDSDVDYAMSYISQNYGDQKILDYLKNHWNEQTRFDKTKYLQELVNKFPDVDRIEKIEGIVEEYNVPIGEKFMSKLNSQKKFIETNREVIKDWLTRNNLDDSTHNKNERSEEFIPMSKRAFVPTRQAKFPR